MDLGTKSINLPFVPVGLCSLRHSDGYSPSGVKSKTYASAFSGGFYLKIVIGYQLTGIYFEFLLSSFIILP